MTSLADLEARVAALEADRADYRAVLSAVGALGLRVDGFGTRFDGIDERLGDVTVTTNANREAINALGEKLAVHQADTRAEFSALRKDLDNHRHETRANFRAVDEQLAEIRDLIVGGFNGRLGQ